ncbi:hypothetical protein PX52LOC_02800 [Limnoglobus roseus]|uniref:Uncharacterized protein n=1 Tax=Limnoglobus roseus TaxID=2598579 RepID=A0A5C1AFF1_9BACT|nr:hypothetical protein PX52LOC_02800 [Limnoglobus roseus]
MIGRIGRLGRSGRCFCRHSGSAQSVDRAIAAKRRTRPEGTESCRPPFVVDYRRHFQTAYSPGSWVWMTSGTPVRRSASKKIQASRPAGLGGNRQSGWCPLANCRYPGRWYRRGREAPSRRSPHVVGANHMTAREASTAGQTTASCSSKNDARNAGGPCVEELVERVAASSDDPPAARLRWRGCRRQVSRPEGNTYLSPAC